MNFQSLHPLQAFYSAEGKPLPTIEIIDSRVVPEPYKSLLVHENDMTPTLEAFHKGPVHLQVLGSRLNGHHYSREVILRMDGTNQAVEFGAIQLHLERFTAAAREEILREHLPVGHILEQYHIQHTSHPGAYLRITSDATINALFGMQQSQTLYGRRNTLLNPAAEPLAEIIEILPLA